MAHRRCDLKHSSHTDLASQLNAINYSGPGFSCNGPLTCRAFTVLLRRSRSNSAQRAWSLWRDISGVSGDPQIPDSAAAAAWMTGPCHEQTYAHPTCNVGRFAS
jgi:hypothetical protein